MSAVANYKAYFNAFDEHVQQPKIPDNQVVNSAGIKARDTYVLRCKDILEATPGGIDDENQNILIYFHPGLSQNFYVMSYRFRVDTPDYIKSGYNTEWRILKLGNNGCPFKIRQTYHFGAINGLYNNDTIANTVYKDESGLRIKSARIVSSGMRLFNVGLQVADVLEIKQDHRLPVNEWANMINTRRRAEDIGVFEGNPELVPFAYGNMMNPFPVRLQPWSDAINYEGTVDTEYGNFAENNINLKLLNGNLSWENAPFHLVIPSGSVRGIQINAVPTSDNRHFRTWNDLICTQSQWMYRNSDPSQAGDHILHQYPGFTESYMRSKMSNVHTGTVEKAFNLCDGFFPTIEGEKILDYIADPDFLGTWIQIIQPNEDLELLIECVTNYEIMCYPDSVYYTFQTYNEKINVSLSDVRTEVEKVYGTLYSWDVDTARSVSRLIDKKLSNIPVSGSTSGDLVNRSNFLSISSGMQDNGVAVSRGGGGVDDTPAPPRPDLSMSDEVVPDNHPSLSSSMMPIPDSTSSFNQRPQRNVRFNIGGVNGRPPIAYNRSMYNRRY